jgi:hypothetical protein
MDKTWTKALRDSISEVFSTMFFMVPEEDEGLADRLAAEDAAGWLEGWVEITRPGESVRLWVWAGPGLAKELAGNILSLEEEDLGPEEVLDAYAEMLNMVAGSVLTAVDPDSQWKLGLPQARRREGGRLGELAGGAQWTLGFDVESRPLLAGAGQTGEDSAS